MSPPRNALLALLLVEALGAAAQPANDDCNGALGLCAGQAVEADNTGSQGSPGFCADTGHMLWYTFTTNSVGGPVQVTLDHMQCPDVAGMDNELSAVVLSGDGSCNPGSFAAVSSCMEDSAGFTLTTSALQPATTYWLVIAGASNGGAVTDAQCGFRVEVSGPGADVVGVDFSAGPDVSIPLGGNTQLNATGGQGYLWSPSSGLSGNAVADPIAGPLETTHYAVATEVGDCSFSDTVIVSVVRLIDPVNTFTPNGDGINDTWDIPAIVDYPQAEVSVYDRWGQRVFHSLGYRDPFTGAGLPMATYYWYIRLNTLKSTSAPYTGSVTIVR